MIMRRRLLIYSLLCCLSLVTIQVNAQKKSEGLTVQGVELSDAFPNPASSFVNFSYTLNTSSEAEASIEVFNLIGEVVISRKLDGSTGTKRISTSSLDKGVYFYRLVVGGKKSQIKKLIVR